MGEPAKKPVFTENEIEGAFNRAMSTKEQDRYIEQTFHIDRLTLEDLDLAYPGIRDAALYPAEYLTEYENTLVELLNRIKEIKEANIKAKTLPYELPLIPKKLPVMAFEIVFPDFIGSINLTEKDVMKALEEITAENAMQRKKEAMEELDTFFGEEEKRLANTDKNIQRMQKKTRKQLAKIPPLELNLEEDFPEGK